MKGFKQVWILLSLALVAQALAPASARAGTSSDYRGKYRRLKLTNNFKTPEEVVRYYCERDASGFVWSGLMETERAAFTLWSSVPQQDSFYVAKKYEIRRDPASAQKPDEAIFDVIYQLTAIADGHGTRVPAGEPVRKVRFDLKRVGGQWKIASPAASEISPVVLESSFPFIASHP